MGTRRLPHAGGATSALVTWPNDRLSVPPNRVGA